MPLIEFDDYGLAIINGTFCVGHVTRAVDEDVYFGIVQLPGATPRIIRKDTEREAKVALMDAVWRWVERAGLKVADDNI